MAWITVTRTWADHVGERHEARIYVNTDHIRYVGPGSGPVGAHITWSQPGLMPMDVVEPLDHVLHQLTFNK